MPLPIDLIIVRHGESEGNIAIGKAVRGDESLFTEDFRKRHTSSYRLTDKGISQAKSAGSWLKKNFKPTIFGRYITSEYTRAMETAANFGLPKADWQIDPLLREREWGDLDNLSLKEQKEIFAHNLHIKDSEPFYWKPPNGESLIDVCSGRLMWVLNSLEKRYSDSSAIIVCHEEVVWAFRILLEKLRQADLKNQFGIKDKPENMMVNCQIFHYTRKSPETGEMLDYPNWVRTVDPVNQTFETEWREIFPTIARFSNEDLLKIVSKTKRVINN